MRCSRWLPVIAAVCCADSLLSQEVGDLFAALEAHYAEHPPSYPSTWTSLRSRTVSQKFPGGVRIHYVEDGTAVYDSSLGGQFDHYGGFHRSFGSGETATPTTRILETQVDRASENWYVFDFSLGPSMDPHFIVHRVHGNSTAFVGRLYCLDLFIPGDGAIYTAGHVNSMFDVRRRYAIEVGASAIIDGDIATENDRLTEVPQPFYWVGLETVTTGPLALYSQQLAVAATDTLPAGTPITVLLNQDDLYLIRTDSGGTGWAVVESSYYTPIRHLVFRGD